MPDMQGSAPAPEAPQGKQASPSQIVDVVGQGLAALGQMLEGKPELQSKVGDLINGLKALVAEISGQGEQESPEEEKMPMGQPSSMNQGGNPNAQAAM